MASTPGGWWNGVCSAPLHCVLSGNDSSCSCPRSHSLADDLLDGLVEEVCLELDQLCDSCVEQLYSHEFARPSDTPS